MERRRYGKSWCFESTGTMNEYDECDERRFRRVKSWSLADGFVK